MTINLDDDFLDEVGLADMPAEDRRAFLQHVYETVELRVGSAMAEGMRDGQLREFEAIIDRDGEAVAAWLDANAPDFQQDPVYRRIEAAIGGDVNPAEVVCEYAATKWLALNRPDHLEVVRGVVEMLKVELRRQAPQIIASCRGGAASGAP